MCLQGRLVRTLWVQAPRAPVPGVVWCSCGSALLPLPSGLCLIQGAALRLCCRRSVPWVLGGCCAQRRCTQCARCPCACAFIERSHVAHGGLSQLKESVRKQQPLAPPHGPCPCLYAPAREHLHCAPFIHPSTHPSSLSSCLRACSCSSLLLCPMQVALVHVLLQVPFAASSLSLPPSVCSRVSSCCCPPLARAPAGALCCEQPVAAPLRPACEGKSHAGSGAAAAVEGGCWQMQEGGGWS